MKLTDMKCVPCEGGQKPFDAKQIAQYSKQLKKDWKVVDGKILSKNFKFKSYPETIAFVNKIALMAQEEGHHPDLEVGYKNLIVKWTTHAVGGLSENDFIMAAKIDS